MNICAPPQHAELIINICAPPQHAKLIINICSLYGSSCANNGKAPCPRCPRAPPRAACLRKRIEGEESNSPVEDARSLKGRARRRMSHREDVEEGVVAEGDRRLAVLRERAAG
eukprot:2294404-Pyramimonas_sp.AAC.1